MVSKRRSKISCLGTLKSHSTLLKEKKEKGAAIFEERLVPRNQVSLCSRLLGFRNYFFFNYANSQGTTSLLVSTTPVTNYTNDTGVKFFVIVKDSGEESITFEGHSKRFGFLFTGVVDPA
jgi:hypothetical protein